MNAIIAQAKKNGSYGVLRFAHGAYIADREMGRSHEKAFAAIARGFYITEEQFAAMVEEFGAFEQA